MLNKYHGAERFQWVDVIVYKIYPHKPHFLKKLSGTGNLKGAVTSSWKHALIISTLSDMPLSLCSVL